MENIEICYYSGYDLRLVNERQKYKMNNKKRAKKVV